MEAYQRHAVVVVKILPVRIAPQVDPGRSVTREIVIVGEFLTFPEHGYALTCVERDDQRLETPEAASVPWRGGAPTRWGREDDQLAVVVGIQVLQRCDRHVHRSAGAVHDSLGAGIEVTKEGIECVYEVVGEHGSPGNRFGVIEEAILPRTARIRVT